MDRSKLDSTRPARTSPTSGLFSFVPGHAFLRAGTVLLGVLATLTCAEPPPPGTPEPEPVRTLPALASGGVSPGASAEAARLLRDAREALQAGRPAEAVELARRVAEEFPGAPGSSEALWFVARGEAELEEWASAAEAAGGFRSFLPAGHPLGQEALMLHGRALAESEQWGEATRVLLSLPESAPDDRRTEALDRIRSAVTEMSFLDLEAIVGDSAVRFGWQRLMAPVLAEYALGLHVRSLEARAREWAESALDLGAEGPEAELARSVLEGDVNVARRSSVVLGALLPESGSPSERQYATLIAQGIAARIQGADGVGRLPAETAFRDDSGSVSALPGLLQELSGQRVVGIVGPLGATSLDSAARARSEPVPLISPTAERVPDSLPAVYSLNDLDPGGALTLARFAVARGLRTAMLLHAGTAEHTWEADVFAEEYQRLGGVLLDRRSYTPGATFFEEPLTAVRAQIPDALVLPVPASDIELLAPQLTYFGLDTLGIRVLGTEAWGEPEIVRAIEPRHLNGIVVATPRPPGAEMPGWERFVEDYESVHRQTLRSRVPAFGYDAAGLLLEAVSRGAREPEEIREALEGIEDFPGATGYLSVVDGRIRRRYHLMRPRDGEVIPVETEPWPGAATR